MARKQVFNKELSDKAKSIKGEVRSEVAMAAINARASVQPDKKRNSTLIRKEKYKPNFR